MSGFGRLGDKMKTFIKVRKQTEEYKLAQVHCNKCGERCDFDMQKDWASMEVNWGFYSQKDLEKHAWDLCESCYDVFVETFKIPIGRFEYDLVSRSTGVDLDEE